MCKGLHKVFKTVVKEILQEFPPLIESGSEVSHFIPETINFAVVKKLPDNIRKPCIKSTVNEIINLINKQTFIVEDPEKDDPVSPCMDVYKAKIQYYGSLNKLKLVIIVSGYMENKELVGDNWSPIASMRNLTYFLADATKDEAIVHKLYFIGAFLQAKVNNRVFLKLDSRYTYYFP